METNVLGGSGRVGLHDPAWRVRTTNDLHPTTELLWITPIQIIVPDYLDRIGQLNDGRIPALLFAEILWQHRTPQQCGIDMMHERCRSNYRV